MKLELNREAQVSLHGQAADIEWTFEAGKMTVCGATDSAIKNAGSAPAKLDDMVTVQLTLEQAAATIALFIAGQFTEDEALTNKLYLIAEEAWKDVPTHLRPIP